MVTMQDPVADMLTRIRNAQRANHQQVQLISSNLKQEIARVLQEEGYISGFVVTEMENNLKTITIELKYFKGKAVIARIKRISRPGLRIYKSFESLAAIPGFGIAILSTSKGVMSHIQAKLNSVGGEVLCEVA